MAGNDRFSSCRTLTGLLKKAAEEFSSRTAVAVPGKYELTHGRLDVLVDETAQRLVRMGIRPGDVVTLTFPNTAEFVVAILAVIRARATAAPLASAYNADEFEFFLVDLESRFLLTPDGTANSAAGVSAAKLGIPQIAVSIDASTLEVSLSGDVSDEGGVGEAEKPICSVVNGPHDVALLLHTSGTTSRPMGVPLNQENLAASTGNIVSVYDLCPSDATVLVLPLLHGHGLVAGFLSPLIAGGLVVLPASGRFSASTFWTDMRAYKATWYTAYPVIHQILLDRHFAKPEPEYPALRFIRSCSAALAPALMERLEVAFGTPVLEAYAMTEATHMMTSNPLPSCGPHKPGCVGRPVGQEMAILDEEGAIQKVNVNGEVCIRGPNVTKGYKNNPEANKWAFRFGWFHTGDLGFMDSDGYLHLVGRIKEFINRGGDKISPIEVDSVLMSHADVALAVAFGVPDDRYGEEINCALVPKEGVEIEEEEFLRFCKRNLVRYKVPKRVFFMDSIPRTATGKIQRRLVAEHCLTKVSAATVPNFGA